MEGLTIFPCDVYKRENPFHETEVGTSVEKNNYLELVWVGQKNILIACMIEAIQGQTAFLERKVHFRNVPEERKRPHGTRYFLGVWAPDGNSNKTWTNSSSLSSQSLRT